MQQMYLQSLTHPPLLHLWRARPKAMGPSRASWPPWQPNSQCRHRQLRSSTQQPCNSVCPKLYRLQTLMSHRAPCTTSDPLLSYKLINSKREKRTFQDGRMTNACIYVCVNTNACPYIFAQHNNVRFLHFKFAILLPYMTSFSPHSNFGSLELLLCHVLQIRKLRLSS